MTMLNPKKWFKIARCEKSYTVFFDRLIQINDLVLKASLNRT